MEGFTWCLKQDIKETGGAWIAILSNKSFTKASATTFQILKHIGRELHYSFLCGILNEYLCLRNNLEQPQQRSGVH